MQTTLAQTKQTRQKPFSKEVRAKLYPNGECVIYKQKKQGMKPVERPSRLGSEWLFLWLNRSAHSYLGMPVAWLCAMGLSHLPNFDKRLKPVPPGDSTDDKGRERYGKKGITAYGARRVRCACHLLEQGTGKHRVVFATATIPSLPVEQMATLHERWSQVVDAYRRKLTRLLKQNGLTGEIVTVVEVQEKRYQATGIPVLHIHSAFVGKAGGRTWVVTPELHDQFWRDSLGIALGSEVPKLRSACNLQRVKKSTEGYLGKYMTKGSKVVAQMIADGFDRWLPKQWWSCSRTLSQRIDEQTRDVTDIAEWLNDVAEIEGCGIWVYHRDVFLEFEDGHKFRIARYGRLNKRITAQIQAMLSRKKIITMAY